MTNEQIGKRIEECRIERGMTVDEVASIVGINKSTVSRYENGTIRTIKIPVIESISRAIGVNPAWVIGKSPNKYEDEPQSVSSEGHQIGILFDRATSVDKMLTHSILDKYADKAPAPPQKLVPLFPTAAAAGKAEMDTGLPFEHFAVPADSPASFAVRVSGDSMEPVLHDGDVVLCVEREPQIGDVAVIMINGALVIKQFITDNYRNLYLRSLNRDRKDCDLDIMASGNDTVHVYGVVLLKKRPPLVDE